MSKLITVGVLGLVLVALVLVLSRDQPQTTTVEASRDPLIGAHSVPEPEAEAPTRAASSDRTTEPASDRARTVEERLKDEAELHVLREQWATIHAKNIEDRAKEIQENGTGTARLRQVLESSGVLLEQIPPTLEEFSRLCEVERAAVADLLTLSGSRRERYGQSPFEALGNTDRTELQERVKTEGISFPPEYMVLAMGKDPERIDSSIFLRIRELRIAHLSRLASLLADQQCRINSTVKLGVAAGFGNEIKPSSQTPVLDPSFSQIGFYMTDEHLRYMEAVTALLRGQ